MTFNIHRKNITENGFSILDNIYSAQEIEQLLGLMKDLDSDKSTFRKSDDLFAVRQFLKEIPKAKQTIFNPQLKQVIREIFGNDYFLVKSIYFDKPEKSNWFVSYHQDLTISVDKKIEIDGFGPYTLKQNQYSVQPPLHILQDNFTIRIHLDDTSEENGALKIIRGSHLKGIYRPENIDRSTETEISCNVPAGGIMIMKPLLLHSSARTTNSKQRRVIHLEFSKATLPAEINWSELLLF